MGHSFGIVLLSPSLPRQVCYTKNKVPIAAATCRTLPRKPHPLNRIFGHASAAEETAREGAFTVRRVQPSAPTSKFIRFDEIFGHASLAVEKQPRRSRIASRMAIGKLRCTCRRSIHSLI